ncbi:MAG: HAD-IIIA family hydrolase [Planctomycetota bacterium]|nr:HAD-IIIA family hydrolase [Planctomycetota bacterium]
MPDRPAVFLDRDDTLIDNRGVTAHTPTPGDLFDPALVRLLPGVGEGCAKLQAAGFALVVTTLQGGIAMGLGTMDQVEAVNDALRSALAKFKVTLDGVYYCPARPHQATPRTIARWNRPHPWRKPAPGMIQAAALDLGLDLSRSWTIGDMPRDVEAGVNAGLPASRCVRIAPGDAGAARDFADAVARVLRGHRKG